MKLYRQTGDTNWLDLAKFFLDVRGKGAAITARTTNPSWTGTKPSATPFVRTISTVAWPMSPRSRATNAILTAITKIWENVVGTKLHLTGGWRARER